MISAEMDEAAARRVITVLFDPRDAGGNEFPCSCHPRLSAEHGDGFDCRRTWDEDRRAAEAASRQVWWDSRAAAELMPDTLVHPPAMAQLTSTTWILPLPAPGSSMRFSYQGWFQTGLRTFSGPEALCAGPCCQAGQSGTKSLSNELRLLKGLRGGDGNRTRVQGFAGPCLSHSATPPQERASPAAFVPGAPP